MSARPLRAASLPPRLLGRLNVRATLAGAKATLATSPPISRPTLPRAPRSRSTPRSRSSAPNCPRLIAPLMRRRASLLHVGLRDHPIQVFVCCVRRRLHCHDPNRQEEDHCQDARLSDQGGLHRPSAQLHAAQQVAVAGKHQGIRQRDPRRRERPDRRTRQIRRLARGGAPRTRVARRRADGRSLSG